jgi:hypothetical protein
MKFLQKEKKEKRTYKHHYCPLSISILYMIIVIVYFFFFFFFIIEEF